MYRQIMWVLKRFMWTVYQMLFFKACRVMSQKTKMITKKGSIMITTGKVEEKERLEAQLRMYNRIFKNTQYLHKNKHKI